MSHSCSDIPQEEWEVCTRCGCMEPYYCMHPIDNYDVLCDDCYEEMLREEAAAEAEAEEHSLGLVFVREGKIVGKYGTLVHPKPDDYDVERLNKLGLSSHDIDNAPDFNPSRVRKVFREYCSRS